MPHTQGSSLFKRGYCLRFTEVEQVYHKTKIARAEPAARRVQPQHQLNNYREERQDRNDKKYFASLAGFAVQELVMIIPAART